MGRRFIILAVVCVVGWAVFDGVRDGIDGVGDARPARRRRTAAAKVELSEKDIVYSARYAVKRFLRSPGSAVFPIIPDDTYRVISIGSDTYVASGEVTAKNAFGVAVRESWQVRLRFTGRDLETVNVGEVTLGGEIIYNAP